MQVQKDIELLDNSSVLLRITLGEEDVQREYDAVVKDYCGKMALPGFRRGHVPAEVLIRKFGDSLKAEAAQALIEKSLGEALPEVEHKPLPYARPELKDEIKLELGKPFVFEVTYDTYPKVELGGYRDLEVEEAQVEVGDEDIGRELQGIQRQNGIVVDKPEGAKVEKDDTITIDYVEVRDDGGDEARTRREGFTFMVGSGYNLYGVDENVVGMAKGEERVIEKEYPADHQYSDLAGRKVRLRVKLTALKQTQLPEVNDELAQDVSDRFQTLEDLKNDIRTRLQQAANERLRGLKVDQLMKQIVAGSKITFPVSMVERELHSRWHEFVRRMGGNEDMVVGLLKREGRSVDDLLAEWRPSVEESIRRRVAIQEIADREKIELADNELDDELRGIAEGQSRPLEELRREYEQSGLLPVLREERRLAKAYDLLIATAKLKKARIETSSVPNAALGSSDSSDSGRRSRRATPSSVPTA